MRFFELLCRFAILSFFFIGTGFKYLADFNSYENSYEGKLVATYIKKHGNGVNPYVIKQVFLYSTTENEYNYKNCSRESKDSYVTSKIANREESKVILGTYRIIYPNKYHSNRCVDNNGRLHIRNIAIILLLMPIVCISPIIIYSYYETKQHANNATVVPEPRLSYSESVDTPPVTARYYSVTDIDNIYGTHVVDNTIVAIDNITTTVSRHLTNVAAIDYDATIPTASITTIVDVVGESVYTDNSDTLPIVSIV